MLGYHSAQGNRPLYGADYMHVNAMVRYGRKITARRIDWRVQLNVDNLFNEDELLVTDADQNRAFRYVYQNPRRWSVSSTFGF